MRRTRSDIVQPAGRGAGPQRAARVAEPGARVAMLLENNPYPRDTRVRQEAESLAAAGYRVCVIAPRGPGQARRERLDGVEVRRFRLPQARGGALSFVLEYAVAFLALNLAAARELLRGAGVLHLHNPPDILFTAAAAARTLGRRVVFDSHDLFPELVAAKFGGVVWERLALGCERASFALANHVLAANESHAEVARGRGGKDESSVTVVRNAPPARAVARSVTIRPGSLSDPLVVYVGAISGQDGVEGLAAVMRDLASTHGLSGARLRVVGDGDHLDRLRQAAVEHGVSERVEITGWVDAGRVPGLIAEADVCVDPAPPSELNQRSTMIKIAEYMAAGKPVVAYDLLETRRTLGDAGLLVPAGAPDRLAEAIARLAADESLRADLSARALEDIRGGTWEHSQAALLGAYRSLTA